MLQAISIELEMPGDLARFRLPRGVNARLHELLDRQDSGVRLTSAERKEAEGLVSLSEMLSLLRLRAKREAGVREGEQRRRQSGPQSKPKLR